MNPQFFPNAINTRTGNYCTFQHVEGNVNNNYFRCINHQECEKDRVMPKQSLFREFFMGDVFLREKSWATELDVAIRKPSTNPFRVGVETRVKVVKKHHTATIFPYSDQTFTVITLELENKKDEETTRFVSRKRSFWPKKAVTRFRSYGRQATRRFPLIGKEETCMKKLGSSKFRSVQFPKMLGLLRSDVPSFILYQGTNMCILLSKR
ncbi:hypothetical protein PM082_018543 [Marasmius tenuissimus]|nr:hypothetical protein PM082_018543 [Marasmius tenuissimus]